MGAEEQQGDPLGWAVIGAGPSGLAAARNLTRRDIRFTGFEVHTDVGGLWDIESPKSTMYESAHLISSKTTTAYDELPMRDEVADYPSHREMRAYFQEYADIFGLRRHFRFGTEVIRAEPETDGEGSTWLVATRDLETGEQETGRYAGILIANGILSEPSVPDFPGREEFGGEVLHTSVYRRPDISRDRRVLIVGAGNSGCDIAVDAVHFARSVEISMRSGCWFFPKYIFGRPSDTLNEGHPLPAFLKTRIDGRFIRLLTGNPARLGFPEPNGRIYETHPVMNTQVLYHAGHGDIGVRKNIERFTSGGVRFVDGSEGEYDLVVLATGYRLHYPFIDPEHLNWSAGHPDLYLNIFTPKHPNVFVLGMVEAAGFGWQGRYNQADLVGEFILASQRTPARARTFWQRVNGPKPDLFAGYNYRQLDRLPYYVNKDAYRRVIREHLELLARAG